MERFLNPEITFNSFRQVPACLKAVNCWMGPTAIVEVTGAA
jgi:hypothetical protein